MSTEQKHAPTMCEAICSVMREVPEVAKDEKNREQGYMFASEAAISNAVRPLMAKHGLSLIPLRHEIQRGEYTTKGGTLMHVSEVAATYRLAHVSGESIEVSSLGTGVDSGDKATPKALTMALKSLLVQLFLVGRSDADADAETPEPRAHVPPERRASPPPPKIKAEDGPGPGPVMRFGRTKGTPLADLETREIQGALDWANSQDRPGAGIQAAKRELEEELQARLSPRKSSAGTPPENDDEIPF